MRVDVLVRTIGIGISLGSAISIFISQKMNGWWLFGIVLVMIGILIEKRE